MTNMTIEGASRRDKGPLNIGSIVLKHISDLPNPTKKSNISHSKKTTRKDKINDKIILKKIPNFNQ